MPIHNTGEKLKMAIDSVIAQEFRDFELICVDDASDDVKTNEILYSYSGIQIIKLEQAKGAAVARNIGKTIATGEYLIFLDSDDYFYPSLLNELYDAIIKDDADLAVCEYDIFYEDMNELETVPYKMFEDKTNPYYLSSYPRCPWAFLAKREFLDSNKIEFQDLTSSNDVYYSIMSVSLAKKIGRVHKSLLRYSVGSHNYISNRRNPYNSWLAISKIMDDLDVQNNPYLRENIDNVLVGNTVYELKLSSNEQSSKKLYQTVQQYLKDTPTKFEGIKKRYADAFLKNGYETKWFFNCLSYKEQLEKNKFKEFMASVDQENIFLWGMGKRAMSLIEWAQKNNLSIKGVCKSVDENIGDNLNKIEIYPNEYVLNEAKTIVASNHDIYYSLKGKTTANLVDLEAFCPW